jgi:imidazole glycerol-phosphate synthase subunit HisH
MKNKIALVDYGMGNLSSVLKKFKYMDVVVSVTSSWKEIMESDKIILVGVGHFGKAMDNLKQLDLIDSLTEAVMEKHKPVLGICLGMQLMAKTSEEGDADGLSWIDANVKRIQVSDTVKYKVPHVGWNQIIKMKDSALMKGVGNADEFYFAHSYHMDVFDSNLILNVTEYSNKFVSGIERDNIFGVQYHPEKSHDAGDILLSNFVDL